MKVERSQTTTITITDVQGLDPVTVFLQNFGPGRWRVTVECYGQAWSTFFGNIGDGTIEHFLSTCGGSPHYLMNALINGARHHMLEKRKPSQEKYLGRIVEAIKQGLKEHGAGL